MKLSIRTIADSVQALGILYGLGLPVGAAYRLTKFIKLINAEMDTFNTTRLELAKQYGHIGEANGQSVYKFETADEKADFARGMDALLSEEIELPDIVITESELGAGFGKSDNVISASDLQTTMDTLSWLIK